MLVVSLPAREQKAGGPAAHFQLDHSNPMGVRTNYPHHASSAPLRAPETVLFIKLGRGVKSLPEIEKQTVSFLC